MRKSRLLILGLIATVLISVALISSCIPSDQGAEGTSSWTLIIFLVLIFVVFYFLMIRPQRKRQKKHEELMEALKRGDKVITTGGIYGQIDRVDQDSIILKVESGATMRVARASIIGKVEEK